MMWAEIAVGVGKEEEMEGCAEGRLQGGGCCSQVIPWHTWMEGGEEKISTWPSWTVVLTHGPVSSLAQTPSPVEYAPFPVEYLRRGIHPLLRQKCSLQDLRRSPSPPCLLRKQEGPGELLPVTGQTFLS